MRFLKINLSKNNNAQFMGNQIGIINNFYYPTNFFYNQTIDLSLRESGKFDELFERQLIIDSPLIRHIVENEKLEKLISLSQLYNFIPTLRIYGCFTSLSTIRQKSEMSDLAQLEIFEKNNILKYIESNYKVKAIISLDTNMIFSNNRYNIEQYTERCSDLIKTIERYRDFKNLEIVFDCENNMETMFILDTIIICYLPSILFNSRDITYGQAILDSEITNIINKINKFDERFLALKRSNYDTYKLMNFNNQKKYIEYIIKSRKDNYFNNF